MNKKIILITGATSGIGKAAAFESAKRGLTVLITARDGSKGESTLSEIKNKTGNPNVKLFICDLSLQTSIHNFTKIFKDHYKKLNILINCAAVFLDQKKLTAEGNELMFATNHLGPFLLTNLLLKELKEAAPSRIINVTAPSTIKPDFNNLQDEKQFNPAIAFGVTKAENLLFTYYLAGKLKNEHITVNAYHPGVTKGTSLMKNAPFYMRWMMDISSIFLQTPEQAARGLIDCALLGNFENITGQLIHKNKIIKAPFQNDKDIQKQLWEISRKLTSL